VTSRALGPRSKQAGSSLTRVNATHACYQDSCVRRRRLNPLTVLAAAVLAGTPTCSDPAEEVAPTIQTSPPSEPPAAMVEPAPSSSPPSPGDVPRRGWLTTIASWYGARPTRCYDSRGAHRPEPGPFYAAHPTLPCGTLVEVQGRAGHIVVPIADHGPNQAKHPERDLDLSPAAFKSVVGALSQGLGHVRYRVLQAAA
jgi:rare lipoprotein A (peptidoglycan hydrolase)